MRTSPGYSPTVESEVTMDFGDAPDEAAFRARLREWLKDNNPGLPASSTSDEYWGGMIAWHHALYDAGFFAMSWPKMLSPSITTTLSPSTKLSHRPRASAMPPACA